METEEIKEIAKKFLKSGESDPSKFFSECEEISDDEIIGPFSHWVKVLRVASDFYKSNWPLTDLLEFLSLKGHNLSQSEWNDLREHLGGNQPAPKPSDWTDPEQTETKPFEPVNGELIEVSSFEDFRQSEKVNFVGMNGHLFVFCRIKGGSIYSAQYARPVSTRTHATPEEKTNFLKQCAFSFESFIRSVPSNIPVELLETTPKFTYEMRKGKLTLGIFYEAKPTI